MMSSCQMVSLPPPSPTPLPPASFRVLLPCISVLPLPTRSELCLRGAACSRAGPSPLASSPSHVLSPNTIYNWDANAPECASRWMPSLPHRLTCQQPHPPPLARPSSSRRTPPSAPFTTPRRPPHSSRLLAARERAGTRSPFGPRPTASSCHFPSPCCQPCLSRTKPLHRLPTLHPSCSSTFRCSKTTTEPSAPSRRHRIWPSQGTAWGPRTVMCCRACHPRLGLTPLMPAIVSPPKMP